MDTFRGVDAERGEVIITWTIRRESGGVARTARHEEREDERWIDREGEGATKVEERLKRVGPGARKTGMTRRTFIPCGYTESLPATKQVGQASGRCEFRMDVTAIRTSLRPRWKVHVPSL